MTAVCAQGFMGQQGYGEQRMQGYGGGPQQARCKHTGRWSGVMLQAFMHACAAARCAQHTPAPEAGPAWSDVERSAPCAAGLHGPAGHGPAGLRRATDAGLWRRAHGGAPHVSCAPGACRRAGRRSCARAASCPGAWRASHTAVQAEQVWFSLFWLTVCRPGC